MSALQIVGRRSSLFTRLPLIFAEELDVPVDFQPIHDMTELSPQVYANNPALKLPILRFDSDGVLFGALNICRALTERSSRSVPIVWPEQLTDPLSRNAQELIWHCMAAQVQIVMGTVIGKLPADNVFFAKARAGLEGSLRWLNAHLHDALQALPTTRELSVLEASLFCLIEHLEFRGTVATQAYSSLTEFARGYAMRPSSQRTAYV